MQVIIFRLPGFYGKVYPDNTQMFAYDNNAPTTIEQIYYLEGLPDNYILTESEDFVGEKLCYVYLDQNTGDSLIFEQYTKKRYHVHFDNKNNEIVPADINGFNGFIWKAKAHNKNPYITIVWDTGDYILSLWCSLNENEAIVLAKSAKIE